MAADDSDEHQRRVHEQGGIGTTVAVLTQECSGGAMNRGPAHTAGDRTADTSVSLSLKPLLPSPERV